jgi:hypothetical protein
MNNTENTAFEIGWYNSTSGDKRKIRQGIITALNINNENEFYD